MNKILIDDIGNLEHFVLASVLRLGFADNFDRVSVDDASVAVLLPHGKTIYASGSDDCNCNCNCSNCTSSPVAGVRG